MKTTEAATPELLPLPRAIGVSRDMDSPGAKSVLVAFERQLSDDELRSLHAALSAHEASTAQTLTTPGDDRNWQLREGDLFAAPAGQQE